MARSYRKLESWEDAFIRLTYPDIKVRDIAAHLNRKPASIITFAAEKLKISKPKIDLIGKKIGKLKVLCLDSNKRGRGKVWKCICDCGITIKAETNTLTSGHSKSCGCGRIDAISLKTDGISKTFLHTIRQSARQRGIFFDLSVEYLQKLFEEQDHRCALTNIILVIDKRKINKVMQVTTASLDRINSNIGYIEGNVQFVHKDINYMKSIYSQNFFIHVCHLVAKHKEDEYAKCGIDDIKGSDEDKRRTSKRFDLLHS